MTNEDLDKLRELTKKYTREKMEELAKRKTFLQEFYESLPSMSNDRLSGAFALWLTMFMSQREYDSHKPMIDEIQKRLTANEEPE